MRHRSTAVLFLALLVPVIAIAQGPSVLAIRAARLIDAKSSAPVTNAVILIEGDKIKSVGDRNYVYTVDNVEGPRPPAVDVFRVELATGARALWKTLAPSDPVGVEDMRETVVITPDAQSYCYSYLRRLGDLFVVHGLK